MTIPETIKRYKWFHLFFWFFVAVIFYLGTNGTAYKPALYIGQAVFVSLFSMIPFYGTAYYIIPKYLYSKRYIMLLLALCIFILLNDLVQFVVIRSILHLIDNNLPVFPDEADTRSLLYLGIWNNCLCVFIAGGLKILSDHLRMEKKLAQSEKEKITMELSFLKSQVNPHFLFNVMNTIYFQVDKTNTAARTTIEKFSEMLRYQLYECSADTISLNREIGYLKNYVEVQRLRMEQATSISFVAEGLFEHVKIAPLLLLPLIENAFKHVSHFSDATRNKISISITYNKPMLALQVSNTVDTKYRNQLIVNDGGVGLQNIRRRLDLIYPEKHEIKVDQGQEYYNTTLQIDLS